MFLLRFMGIAPKNSTILLNTRTSLKGLISASLAISHSPAGPFGNGLSLWNTFSQLISNYGFELSIEVSVTKLTTGRLIDGSSSDGIDMVIEDLDLEPKIDAMMRDFLDKSLIRALLQTEVTLL
ncbi:hypothetical protein Tco_0841450 [Tanacetum coccineum]|uniref:Uncharacterized protein n=1 Tax=Tanacetum coccineum TaxID=301880 RepID=A0ABQ5AZW4_9ASTR